MSERPKSHAYTKRLQELHRLPNPTFDTYRKGIEHSNPAICANVIIGLIRVTCYLLERQIQFLENGGIKERMTRARLANRKAPS